MGFFDYLKRLSRISTRPVSSEHSNPVSEAQRLLEEGIALGAAKQKQEALSRYNAAIRLQPDLAQAHFNLGNLLLEQDNPTEALIAFTEALRCKPDSAPCYFNKGNAHLQLGQFADSISAYRRALQIKPDFADAEVAMGVALQETGVLAEAIACFQRALAIRPNYAEVYLNLGGAQAESGQLDAAINSLHHAVEISPNYVEAISVLGNMLTISGEHQAALEYRHRAIARSPERADLHNDLGVTLRTLGHLEEAKASYQHALAINPNFSGAHSNLAMVLHQLGYPNEALMHYQKALDIDPSNTEATNNLGILFYQCGKLGEAIGIFRKLLQSNPGDSGALSNLGLALAESGRLDEAAATYRHTLEIQPGHTRSRSNLLLMHNFRACKSPSQLLAEAREYGRQVTRQGSAHATWPSSANLDPDRCLHIGIVSADLRQHPVGYFAESVLQKLHAETNGRIKLFAYSNHWQADSVTARIKNSCHGWHTVHAMADEDLAQCIRNDRVDILIDFSGHTSDNRLPLFARKPAAIQASWLGYFATTGVKEIDYLIADPWTLPETEEENFTETIWRLPETRLCFTPPTDAPNISTLPALDTGTVTFGCFNNLTKMNDDVVALWARILTAVPASRLLLKSRQLSENSMRQKVFERFAVHGIENGRLILETYTPRINYLAAYQQVDIALDPFPYPGGTTTVEALWMGIPVLTLAGKSFLARQGVGLLINAGLPDWVADTPEDYVARAVSHASDLRSLAALRAGLREQVLVSPIFDASRFARHFEAALRGMWKKWCDEQHPIDETHI